MVTAGDFKNGITIEYDGKICQIIEFQHVKPGKGAAFVRTKLKDIKSGGGVEKKIKTTKKKRRHSVRQRSSRMHISRERKCSICIRMVIYTTLWMVRHMTR